MSGTRHRGLAHDPEGFIPPRAQWQKASPVLPESKERVLLHLDGDVLRFFKRDGRGYQARINAVLRSHAALGAKTLIRRKGRRLRATARS